MAKEIEEKPKKKRRQLPIAEITLLSVTVLALVFGGFFFYKYQDLNNKYQNLTMSEEDRIRQTVEKVSKLYNIPSFDQEKPTQYIVSDPEQVKSNEFFKDANKDDILLTYPKADLAILFRPSENRIINVGTNSQFAANVEVAVIAPAATQSEIETKLKSKYSNIVVIKKSEPKTQVTKGIVVDVSGTESEAAKTVAELLGYTVGTLPAGETAPEGVKLVVIAPNTLAQ
jgi:hypothetical protein